MSRQRSCRNSKTPCRQWWIRVGDICSGTNPVNSLLPISFLRHKRRRISQEKYFVRWVKLPPSFNVVIKWSEDIEIIIFSDALNQLNRFDSHLSLKTFQSEQTNKPLTQETLLWCGTKEMCQFCWKLDLVQRYISTSSLVTCWFSPVGLDGNTQRWIVHLEHILRHSKVGLQLTTILIVD